MLKKMIKILKYKYVFLIISLLCLAASLLVFASGSSSLPSTVGTMTLPAPDNCAAESNVWEISGLVDIDTFHFSNTRYIKLLPGGTYKIEVEKEPEDANECLVWEIADGDVAEISSDGTITASAPGTTRVSAYTFEKKLRRSALVEVSPFPDTVLDVPYITQVFSYPNGCESVSTVMALNYVGIDITVDEFIEKYLDMSPLPSVGEDGELWGYSPWDSFLGDPRDYSGLCCYAPVIARALDKFVDKDKYEVKELYDVPLEVLCREYVMNNVPVILWGTMYMYDPYTPGWEWNVIGGEEGEVFKWVSPMHCLLLIGFDGENYYFNDPTAGARVAYLKSDVEEAYAGLFRQALVVSRKH